MWRHLILPSCPKAAVGGGGRWLALVFEIVRKKRSSWAYGRGDKRAWKLSEAPWQLCGCGQRRPALDIKVKN